ncbi:conserved protein of unknown function [Tenacibaculum sp. 190524A02b]|uniref:hypothetical protein n=1 Tax=Tenacibaculum vairaonense TaxID=3137860 RepID=UPI0032B1C660
MGYKLILSEESVLAIEIIAKQYDKKEAGLGKHFKSSVKEMLSKIKESPEIFQQTGKNQRRAVLRSSFPYSIHYFLEKKSKTVQIARVFHQHRNQEKTLELLKLDKLHSIKREKIIKQRMKQLEKNRKTKEQGREISRFRGFER